MVCIYYILFYRSGDLLDWVLTHGAFRRDVAARTLTRQLLAAVMHLHANDVVHRDLKVWVWGLWGLAR